MGSGLSPNGLSFNEAGMVSLTLMDKILDIDLEKKQVGQQRAQARPMPFPGGLPGGRWPLRRLQQAGRQRQRASPAHAPCRLAAAECAR